MEGLIFPIFILILLYLVISPAIKNRTRWKSHPTIHEYLLCYPACKTNHGIKCFNCGSGSIKNWGVSNSSDSRRLFICNHCGKSLYRNS